MHNASGNGASVCTTKSLSSPQPTQPWYGLHILVGRVTTCFADWLAIDADYKGSFSSTLENLECGTLGLLASCWYGSLPSSPCWYIHYSWRRNFTWLTTTFLVSFILQQDENANFSDKELKKKYTQNITSFLLNIIHHILQMQHQQCLRN